MNATVKIRAQELERAALDWAVAKCEGKDEGFRPFGNTILLLRANGDHTQSPYSTDWALGGPIIEQNLIELRTSASATARWWADRCFPVGITRDDWCGFGPTPLIAAMRCYVASKLGDEIEVPYEVSK